MRIIAHTPFRRGWSIRLGRWRLRSVPWYWDVFRERLAESSARRRPRAPRPVHHDHYCEECDRRWVHEGHTCAQPWAASCGIESHHGGATGQRRLSRWLIVVRRERGELWRHLGEGFEADPRVTVVLDRRESERRVGRAQTLRLAVERRRWRDRRVPQIGEDRSIWANLGFRVHQASVPGHR
jgi:hypothetical protein